MKGIQFVTDESGRKTAVLIDLRKSGELWEDIYDSLTAQQRADEPRESLESVKKRLQSIAAAPINSSRFGACGDAGSAECTKAVRKFL